MKVIKELKGYSGSKVLLVKDPNLLVRKIGNTARNLERYNELKKIGLPIPKILSVGLDSYDMEYIPNLDIKNFLIKNQIYRLSNFIINLISLFQQSSYLKDYLDIYLKKLSNINFNEFTFNKEQLISKLPRYLPCSNYHGDLTLENILYSVNQGNFVLIDPLTSDYDSWVFDLAKLRQDIECKWFIRNDSLYLESKLQTLSEELSYFDYWNNNYILILMLLRILPYTVSQDKEFIIKEINKLWK